jgi:hypothetical protein
VSFVTPRRSSKDFLLEFRCLQVRHVQANHDLRCLAEPPTGRRARDPEIRADGHVPGALDEIAKPVVVALPRAARGRHRDDHRLSRRSTPRGHCGPSADVRGSAAVTTTGGAECPWRQLGKTLASSPPSLPTKDVVQMTCRRVLICEQIECLALNSMSHPRITTNLAHRDSRADSAGFLRLSSLPALPILSYR